MLTFEKVLEVFKDYLAEDKVCEVILTSRGYTLMYWDEKLNNWYGVEYCETTEDLRDELLNAYCDFLEHKLTLNRRALTEEGKADIKKKFNSLHHKCLHDK